MTPQEYAQEWRLMHSYADPDPRFFGPPDDVEGSWEAPARLAAPAFLTSTEHIGQWHRADWCGVDYRLRYWAALFVEAARKRRIPLYVHCARRSREEQERHYRTGRSKVRFPQSAHNRGAAVDIVHGVFHWDMTRSEWALLGVLGRLALERVNARLKKEAKLTLEWGGDWRFYDPAHWQIAGYSALPVPPDNEAPVRYTPRYILNHLRI